ncbi:fibronectin type III domain-containing protein [Candidatus Poribacteria bacterium]|nr:fibronectin type III domain-containing protein [Candidatus Poribacteria bacterium]MYA70224.1 fibronectin type III domain-containing protein [Candidatus Poribacteria bacterium]MYH83668.1 fibronectin type III domain-containing protein [Candidatus Poribacteria bacterium]MYK95538.1 fibronectin type III domain-containing protein [Candidatus Poribacteria bacterium]
MIKTTQWVAICLVLCLSVSTAFSQESAAPSNVTAVDTPNDDGSSITIKWDAAAEDTGISGYQILRRIADGDLEEIGGLLPAETTNYVDSSIQQGTAYTYIVRAVTEAEATVDSEQTAPVKGTGEWFHTGKTPLFVAMLLFSAAIVWNIYNARSGKEIFVRRIPGLEAVDEALGRATEMGRSILYVLGLGGVDNVATIASMTILGQVARRTADYETPLRVPCNEPVVLNVVREVVKTSYLDEGRPDAYNEENIFFLTGDQFAYAAGVDGMMIREKPAAIFLQGTFAAESLLMAETGNSIGAIQIAGTDSEHQLPFFIAACDYTLIGEELYAASAYLSREPMLLGSLKGQDWGKILIFLTIVLGVVLELFGVNWITTLLQRVS